MTLNPGPLWEDREDHKEHWQAPWKHRPPWASGAHPDSAWSPAWRRRSHFLFIRFIASFGVIVLLTVGGMAVLALLLTRFFGGDGQTALLVWIGGCGLGLALPMLAGAMAFRAYRSIARPLAGVMAAADAVAEGDFSVRVPEYGPGGFSRLALSFNRMVEELARADQQRRNLTADVAHELRTPLHIIQGNLEGVLDGVYEPTPEHVGATLDETRVLARLVEDLQTLSLAEAGQLPLHREPVDVAELLADVETSFSGQAATAGINLTVEIKPGQSLPISADAGRLNQILNNLVANALRHTPAGGQISLRAEPLVSAEGVRLTVQDSGEGIPPDDLPYIFERFWRGDKARSHSGGAGGGLGLAITRQLVQAHGGQIRVESEPGQGTTFVIDLPAGST